MSGISTVLAVVLAATFAVAATLKLRDRRATADDFRSLGLPRANLLAVGVPVIEVAVSVALIVSPSWGAIAAFVMLAAFTTLLVGVIRSGRVVSCACFGGAASAPIDVGHVVRNGVLMAWALPVLALEQCRMPSVAEAVVGIGLAAVPALALHEGRRSRPAD